MPLTLQEIDRLYQDRGHMPYGDTPVTHLQHALQCAALAEQAGASAALITAGLLHDLGHIIGRSPDAPLLDLEGKHHYFVLPFLRGLFGPEVLEPIRLHVEAGRYLCFLETGYAQRLPEPVLAQITRGGDFDAQQATEFGALPWAPEAIRLRRWDDAACTPGMDTPPLGYFIRIAAGVAATPRPWPRDARGPRPIRSTSPRTGANLSGPPLP
jgi:predicted HD phosphohydrolase